MTSLFELPDAARGRAMPVDVAAGGTHGVAMLEFFAVEDGAKVDRERASDGAQHAARERALEMRVMVDAAREDAAAQARRECRAELEQRLGEERERVQRVCAQFAKDRQRYFAAAEAQVVKLAVAIARRVLAREVEADGMVLASVAKAALARVQDGSESTLRVPAGDEETWSEMFVRTGECAVTVVGDAKLERGQCVLETEVGRVELGLAVQMEEIERGFGALTERQGA